MSNISKAVGAKGHDSVQVATTHTLDLAPGATRREHDLLGEADVPAEAYWGIHTLRAVGNFPITGVPVGHCPELVRALALVKLAAARANRRLGAPSAVKADAIERACLRIAEGAQFHDQFVVDVVQGGAGGCRNIWETNLNEFCIGSRQ